MNDQLHAGKLKGIGEAVWHKWDDEPTYFCGLWHRRTPKELFLECATIMADLMNNHPDLLEAVSPQGEKDE